eukprot:SAG22_NODE_238_length_14184_cov_5.966844_3_plen_1199_part_00
MAAADGLRCVELLRREYEIRQRKAPKKAQAEWAPTRQQLEMVVEHRAEELGRNREFLARKRELERDLRQRTEREEAGYKAIVDEMSGTKDLLAEAEESAAEHLELLPAEQQEAEAKRAEADRLGADVQAIQDGIDARLKEAVAMMEAVGPAIEEAKAAVGAIKKPDLDEMKSFGNPVGPVIKTMDALCVLLAKGEADWAKSRMVLRERNFINDLVAFDSEAAFGDIHSAVTQAAIKTLSKYDGDEQFSHDMVAKSSVAATALFDWCRAQMGYIEIVETVQKLKDEAGAMADGAKGAIAAHREAVLAAEEAESRVAFRQQAHATVLAEIERLNARLTELPALADAADGRLTELYDERDRLAAETAEVAELPEELAAADAWLDRQQAMEPPKPESGTVEQPTLQVQMRLYFADKFSDNPRGCDLFRPLAESNYHLLAERLSYSSDSRYQRKRALCRALHLEHGKPVPWVLQCGGCGQSVAACGECMLESAVSDQRRSGAASNPYGICDAARTMDASLKDSITRSLNQSLTSTSAFDLKDADPTQAKSYYDDVNEQAVHARKFFDMDHFQRQPGDGAELAVHVWSFSRPHLYGKYDLGRSGPDGVLNRDHLTFYKRVNRALLKDDIRELKKMSVTIEAIRVWLAAHPAPKAIKLYRGTPNSKEQMHKLGTALPPSSSKEVDDETAAAAQRTFRMPMFVAASEEFATAKAFCRAGSPILEFLVPAGCKNCTPIKAISHYPEEAEWLMPPYTAVEFVGQRHEELMLGVGERKQSVRTLIVTYRVLDWEESLARFERAGQPLKSCLIMCETETLSVNVHSITKGSVRVGFSVEASASPEAQLAVRAAATAVEVGGAPPKRMEELSVDGKGGFARRRRHWSWWDTNYADFLPDGPGSCRHMRLVLWTEQELKDMRKGVRERHCCAMCNAGPVAVQCPTCPGFSLCSSCYAKPLVPAPPKGSPASPKKRQQQQTGAFDEGPTMEAQTYGAAFSSDALKDLTPPGWAELPDGAEMPDGPQRRAIEAEIRSSVTKKYAEAEKRAWEAGLAARAEAEAQRLAELEAEAEALREQAQRRAKAAGGQASRRAGELAQIVADINGEARNWISRFGSSGGWHSSLARSLSLLPSFPPSLLPSFPPSLLPSFPPSLLPFYPPSSLSLSLSLREHRQACELPLCHYHHHPIILPCCSLAGANFGLYGPKQAPKDS